MAKAQFPSGPWVGFYTYHGHSQRALMDLNLRFRDGKIEGDGADGINTFVIAGWYDAQKLECGWQKIYPTHQVDYTGYREGKGIWGTWKIRKTTGGFHIWPLSEGGPPDLRKLAEEEEEELVEAKPITIG
jgi:hypothetical protein